MKKLKPVFTVLAAVIFCFALTACSGFDEERADGCSESFIKAVLSRDESALLSLTHPSYREDIEYGDSFYNALSNYGILAGEPLDGMESTEKKADKDDELNGNLIICSYVVMIDQMPYDAVIYILDSESGYGVIAAEFSFCTDPKYYQTN